jgi:4'-phosphopantetheinyl transferase
MISCENTGWSIPSRIPVLGQSEIHLWRINLIQTDEDERRLKKSLSDEECNRSAAFYFIHDQRRFIIRRAVLRHLLAAYLDMPAKDVQLLSTLNGKPFINGQNGPDGIRFSCSHSADWALVAIGRGNELGVDMEQHRPLVDSRELVNACFSSHEIAEWSALPETLKPHCFFDGWTRKEAFIKALGMGLLLPLKSFSVSLAANQPAGLLNVENDSEAIGRWSMQSLDVRLGYSGAIVFEGNNIRLQGFDWNSHLLP